MAAVVVRLFLTAPLALAIVAATLTVLALILALGIAGAAGHDAEPLLAPFRWPALDSIA